MVLELLRQFLFHNWQSFVTGVPASVIASGIVAILAIKVFRVPSLHLHLDYIPEAVIPAGVRLPVLDASVRNKKRWVGFGKEDVSFGLFLPVEFFQTSKELLLITPDDGQLAWVNDLRGKQKFQLGGKDYYLFRHVVHLAIHPDSRTHFLRIRGDFSTIGDLRIYYYFDTPYGRVPSSLRFGERVQSFRRKKLPYVQISLK